MEILETEDTKLKISLRVFNNRQNGRKKTKKT